MQNLKILNNKEIKRIHGMLEKRFGLQKKIEYAFLINNKEKIYLINKEFAEIETEKLRINSIGMYFGEAKNGEIRLSIEGSQLIGNDCTMNILELNEKDARDWLKGVDIDKEVEDKGYVLIKHNKDFLGCGKGVIGKILNFVPKNRRIRCRD